MEILNNIHQIIVIFEKDIYKRQYNFITNHLSWVDYNYHNEVNQYLFNKLEENFQKLNK